MSDVQPSPEPRAPLPDDAITAAAKVMLDEWGTVHAFMTQTELAMLIAQKVLRAAAPALRAQGAATERARLAAVISAEQIRKLTDWFDEDDKVKMMLRAEDPTLPSTWVERGTGFQEDLRKFADLLDGTDG